jgi:hypothetical protein
MFERHRIENPVTPKSVSLPSSLSMLIRRIGMSKSRALLLVVVATLATTACGHIEIGPPQECSVNCRHGGR